MLSLALSLPMYERVCPHRPINKRISKSQNGFAPNRVQMTHPFQPYLKKRQEIQVCILFHFDLLPFACRAGECFLKSLVMAMFWRAVLNELLFSRSSKFYREREYSRYFVVISSEAHRKNKRESKK